MNFNTINLLFIFHSKINQRRIFHWIFNKNLFKLNLFIVWYALRSLITLKGALTYWNWMRMGREKSSNWFRQKKTRMSKTNFKTIMSAKSDHTRTNPLHTTHCLSKVLVPARNSFLRLSTTFTKSLFISKTPVWAGYKRKWILDRRSNKSKRAGIPEGFRKTSCRVIMNSGSSHRARRRHHSQIKIFTAPFEYLLS